MPPRRRRRRLQAALAADNEEAARRQAEALQQRLTHLTSKLSEAEDERRAELVPGIKAATDEVAGLQGQLAAERAKAAAAQREASDIAARLETVRGEWGRGAGGRIRRYRVLECLPCSGSTMAGYNERAVGQCFSCPPD